MNKAMIVDTNILIRLFTKDDDPQIEQLVRLMEQGDIVFHVLSIVLIEAYWVLHKVYNFNKETILRVFEDFIEADGIELDEEGLVQRILARFRGVNVDFVDIYLAEKSRSSRLPVLTWNAKDFRKLECEFYRPQDLV
ncbi:putative nucleic-acid-binding protein, contains PIN domain [Desulfitobacterium dichloroeliminans LMG P-21439]|uniref:Putative nucleic-acid-binding protein, contains PIN domain n=1 Tax=Desulfitobacterium dichloroeliminans (strain LMG P-21439 / DCA1) TaxID=871963 RepID=L0FBD5_DESDL|nr:PIN domain-containing protein [Desulfitobacterium dichloroeliminans]AGA70507.1 putative nucleic-acid-binding protein, contains PIN domain [Desulfitobacterium dichloroeliminans LMG P-21439]